MSENSAQSVKNQWSYTEYCTVAPYVAAHLWMYFDIMSWNVLNKIVWIGSSRSLYWVSPLPPPERHLIPGWQEFLLALLIGGMVVSILWRIAKVSRWKSPGFWPVTFAFVCLLWGMTITLREVSWRGVKGAISKNQQYFEAVGRSLLQDDDDKINAQLKRLGLKRIVREGSRRFGVLPLDREIEKGFPRVYPKYVGEYSPGNHSVIFETSLTGLSIAYTPSASDMWFVPRKLGFNKPQLVFWGRLAIVGEELVVLAN